jgi:hypothetical protein
MKQRELILVAGGIRAQLKRLNRIIERTNWWNTPVRKRIGLSELQVNVLLEQVSMLAGELGRRKRKAA